MKDIRIEKIKEKIGTYPDFPKTGIIFKDIFSVLLDPPTYKILMEIMNEKISTCCPEVDIIVGLDSRGFLFGSPIALALEKPFVPIRKRGKLPGDVKKVEFTLEYGMDVFEIQSASVKKGQKVVIVDDLLATGGSMKAACELIKKVGGEVALCLVCIELEDLKGREKLSSPVETVVKY